MIFNTEIEKAMIGCMLLGKTEYVNKLTEIDFSVACYQEALQAMRDLYNTKKAIDIISVADELPRITNIFNILSAATNDVPTEENAGYYYRTLKEYSARRNVSKAAHTIIEMAERYEYDNVASFKSDIMKLVDIPINDFQKKSFKFQDIINDTLQNIEDEYNKTDENRLMTGFYDLDKLTAGLHPEELTIIAARPGVGKTVMGVNLIINLSRKGNKCLLVSREMSANQLMKRFIANYTPIDGQKLRLCKTLSGTDFQQLAHAAGEMGEWPIIINDELSTVQEIRAYCRDEKPDVLVVDYLQLCRSAGKIESRRQEIEEISRQFKEISMEFSIPVIVLSQLTRENAKTGRPPELHDLRESGSIEQDADNVIFLHIPKDTNETQDIYDLQVIVAKQRNGPTGYIYLRHYKKTFRLYNIGR